MYLPNNIAEHLKGLKRIILVCTYQLTQRSTSEYQNINIYPCENPGNSLRRQQVFTKLIDSKGKSSYVHSGNAWFNSLPEHLLYWGSSLSFHLFQINDKILPRIRPETLIFTHCSVSRLPFDATKPWIQIPSLHTRQINNIWHHTLEYNFQDAYLSARMHDMPPTKSQTEYSPQ